jgi:hypothetical protein
MERQQRETDRIWREASHGHMQMDKITYRSRAGDLDIPAFVFQPLRTGAPRSAPALVWVHENIRGHLYEHFIPFIRDATARGFVVIAPEYRGSIGYGQAFYDAIDYGGAEVDDVVTAAQVVAERCSAVDPARIGIIGWSHGGLIALLATFRNPGRSPRNPPARQRSGQRPGRHDRGTVAIRRCAAVAQGFARRRQDLRQPPRRSHVRPAGRCPDLATDQHARTGGRLETCLAVLQSQDAARQYDRTITSVPRHGIPRATASS